MSYLKEHVAEFDADELAKVTDACGVQHLSHQPLQSVSFTLTPRTLSCIRTQMLWSFARCGYNDEALLQVMHDIAERMAHSYDRCGWAPLAHGLLQAALDKCARHASLFGQVY